MIAIAVGCIGIESACIRTPMARTEALAWWKELARMAEARMSKSRLTDSRITVAGLSISPLAITETKLAKPVARKTYSPATVSKQISACNG